MTMKMRMTTATMLMTMIMTSAIVMPMMMTTIDVHHTEVGPVSLVRLDVLSCLSGVQYFPYILQRGFRIYLFPIKVFARPSFQLKSVKGYVDKTLATAHLYLDLQLLASTFVLRYLLEYTCIHCMF